MKTALVLLVLVLSPVAIASDAPIAFTPDSVVWKDAPPSLPAGSQIAVLEGDPRSEAMFSLRVRVPAGAKLAPHWHPRHERVTVLSGVVELGFGTVADPQHVTRYGAGSFYVNPPRTMHYIFFPEATELQMTGIGPWEVHTTDIEPKESEATATLSLRTISPQPGSALDKSGSLRATVDYEIRDFRPDSFFLMMQFRSTTEGMTISASQRVVRRGAGPHPPSLPQERTLKQEKGTETVVVDLRDVWRNERIRRPIEVEIGLHELTSDTTSRVVASSGWFIYR